MKSSTSLALTVSAIAITSVNGGSLLSAVLRPRGPEEVYGNINITQGALDVRDAISSPTCNVTTYCEEFVNTVIPQCLKLQGAAGCWCTLHDPLHYCAICMSSPTDNTTTSDQTQLATQGHGNYHRGCAAYQAFLNSTASGSTSAPLSTGTAASSTTDDDDNHDKHGLGTGAIVGIAIGGAVLLALIGAATFLIGKCMKKSGDRVPAAATTEKRQDSMPSGDPVRVTSYYGGMDMGGDKGPNTPPPPAFGYQPQPHQQQGQTLQYAPIPMTPQHSPFSPQSMYSTGGARPDSIAYTDAPSQSHHAASSYNQGMRPGSDFGGAGSSQGGQVSQMGQFHVANAQQTPQDAPPPFSAHPQGYDTSLLSGVPASSNGDSKARY